MALPEHLRLEPRGARRIQLALRVTPALVYIALASFVLVRGQVTPTISAPLICLGLIALALALPLAWRRILGYLELSTTRGELVQAQAELEAGELERAAATYESAAHRVAGRLYAFHAVAIVSAAGAHAQMGHCTLALEILDELDRSGWMTSLALRRSASWIYASASVTRASLGDLEGARRAIAQVAVQPPTVTAQTRDRCAAFVAARGGDADARARIDTALAVGGLGARGEALYLAISAFLAAREGKLDAEAAQLEALRARPRRDYLALPEGWPELHAWLRSKRLADDEGNALP